MNRFIVCVVSEPNTVFTQVRFVWNGGRWVASASCDPAYKFVLRSVAEQWIEKHPTVVPNSHELVIKEI